MKKQYTMPIHSISRPDVTVSVLDSPRPDNLLTPDALAEIEKRHERTITYNEKYGCPCETWNSMSDDRDSLLKHVDVLEAKLADIPSPADLYTRIEELEAKLAEIMGVLQEYDSGNKSCKIVSTSPTTHGIYKSANGQYCHYPTLRDKLKSAILENKS